MMISPHPIHLTDQDISFFNEEGYLLYHHPLFPEPKFQNLKDFFEGMLDDLPEGARPEAMDVPHYAFPELFEWLLADEVLDFVERFIGPDIVLWSSHFLCKPPGKGLAVPWHEDSAYWGEMLDQHKVVTVWLAVDDSQPENGCMRVIPRTHHGGFSDYEAVDKASNVFDTRIVPSQFDESKAVDLAILAGECHLHHAKIVHGSNANTSRRRRCGYTMRYMPSEAAFNAGDKYPHAIYLARGEDKAGNTYADPTRRFEPGANRWRSGFGH